MLRARRLSVSGLCNARDLGGYPTQDGGVTRFGVFVRSEAPCNLPAGAIDALRAYGVGAAADLRGLSEIDLRPSDLRDAMPYYKCPLAGDAESFVLTEQICWSQVYIRRAEGNREWARHVLELAAAQEDCFLFHCTTGKDRTGMIACFLLAIAGVSREDIAADYCLSEVYLQPVFAAMRSGQVQVRKAGGGYDDSVFHTPFTAMAEFQDYLIETYGSVMEYLRTARVSESVIAAIREKFVQR